MIAPNFVSGGRRGGGEEAVWNNLRGAGILTTEQWIMNQIKFGSAHYQNRNCYCDYRNFHNCLLRKQFIIAKWFAIITHPHRE